jgi:hypothetical protein
LLDAFAAVRFKGWRQVPAMHQHSRIFQPTYDVFNDGCPHSAAQDHCKPEEVPPQCHVTPGTPEVLNLL